MYNDYYLQQINDKLGQIQTNTSTIITNQQTITEEIQKGSALISMTMALYVILYFIVRAFK